MVYVEEIGQTRLCENENTVEVKIPLKKEELKAMQKKDSYCRDVANKLRKKQHMNKMFVMENGILYRFWIEHDKTFRCILVPNSLRDALLTMAHQHSRHNGPPRTYSALKREYYWPGMRKDVFKHCKSCYECRLQNQGQPDDEFKHFTVPELPMEMICMDLVGPISPVTTTGNRYILTVIDMLTGYTIAVPIPDKRSETVCGAYRDNVYCIFGGSSRILRDNGMEFRSKEMKAICEELNIKHVFSPVYTPQANGRLEEWHHFLKACLAKHIRGTDLEWDKLVPLVVSAYNFFPCQSSRESPFVLMFGRDPITPITKLLEPRPRYYGDKGGTLRMDTLRKLLRKTSSKLQIGDLVFIRDPDSGVFEPRYSPNYRIIAIHGANRIEVQDEKGHKWVRRAGHVKRIDPVDKICQQLPPEEVYKQFGRASKLLLHPKDVPDIKLQGKEETINHEIQNEGEENTTLCELITDEKIGEEPINRLGNKGSLGPTVKWTETRRCEDSKDSEKLLNRMRNEKGEALLPYRGKERHTEMNTDNKRIASEKYQKSIIRYSMVKGNLQEMNWTSCIQKEYQLSEGMGSEKGKKLIIRCSTVTGSPQEMKVTPYNSNNDVAKKTEEFNKVDLQQGWGKTISFITNTSKKLGLTIALRSLAQIPVVTKIDRAKENELGEENDLNSVGLISDSSYTFFL